MVRASADGAIASVVRPLDGVEIVVTPTCKFRVPCGCLGKGRSVLEYRLYYLKQDGSIRSRLDLAYPTDGEAILAVTALAEGGPIELWQSSRFLLRSGPESGDRARRRQHLGDGSTPSRRRS